MDAQVVKLRPDPIDQQPKAVLKLENLQPPSFNREGVVRWIN